MGIQKCGLNLNSAQKELRPHGMIDFPCAAYSEDYSDDLKQAVSWHWHEELEIAYVKDGRMKLQIPGRTFLLEKGDCAVINSNILHYAIAAPQCRLQSLVFHPALVTGKNDSVFAVKYLLPLISQTTFNGYLLKADGGGTEIGYFISAFKALADETPGFEFTVRENLSKICYFLYSQYSHEIADKKTGLNHDSLRIKKMLTYIHHHFSENIALADIAKAADIGERECLRCFQRTIKLSPMQYLLKYRMMQGADILLKEPAMSVSEAAMVCGFDSLSNFSKMFRRFYNCTPREYRNSKAGLSSAQKKETEPPY